MSVPAKEEPSLSWGLCVSFCGSNFPLLLSHRNSHLEEKKINYLKKRSVNKSSSYFACTMSKIPLPQQMARPPEGVLRLGCAVSEHNSRRQKLCSNEDKFW